MSFEEFCKKYDEIKMKYDIIVLSELIKLYRDYGKENPTIKTIYNELQDPINYTKEQEQLIIQEAEKLSKEQD